MLARRLMSRARRRTELVLSPATHVWSVELDPANPARARYPVGVVSSKVDGTPIINEIPDVLATQYHVAGSHLHGTITIAGYSEDDALPDLGPAPAKASIFACTPDGIAEHPIERLPSSIAVGGSIPANIANLCRDFAFAPQTNTGQSLRTGATALLSMGTSSSHRLYNLGQSLVAVPQVSGSRSLTNSPSAQGLTSVVNSNTANGPTGIRRLTISARVVDETTPAGAVNSARVATAYDTMVRVPWDFCRITGTVAEHRYSNIRLAGGGFRRWGSVFHRAEIVSMEVVRSAFGADQTYGDYVLHPCDLTIHFSRRIGLLRAYPDGSFDFMPWFEERYEQTSAALNYRGKRISTGAPGTDPALRGGTFYGPALTAWPTMPAAFPVTTLLDLDRPVGTALSGLDDRVFEITAGTIRSWAFDGTYLGSHPVPSGGVEVVPGENLLIGNTSFSRDAGATWTPYGLSAGEKVPLGAAYQQTIRLY